MAQAAAAAKVVDNASAPPPREWQPKYNPWIIAVTVTLATFMEVLDTSIANVALPHIAGNLGAGQDESTWVLTSYLVSNAIVLPLSAWFSSLIGRKNFYMLCVAVFTISSFLCGLAPSLAMLIFFRVVQGIGGGGLQPSEQAILADTFKPSQRGMGFAVYGLAVVTAPAIGPTLGGYITDNFDWRWIFFINIPVGILSLFLTHRLVEDPPHARAKVRTGSFKIDYIGISLVAIGLGALQVVLDKGQEDDWFESHFIVLFAIFAGVGLIGGALWEWFHKQPAVDLRLLKERNFAGANALMFMVGFILLGSTVLLPLMMQTLFGYTAESAGMVISPGGFLIMCLMPIVGILLSKTQPKYLITFGLVLTSAALWHMTSFSLQLDFWGAAHARMWQAAGLAFLFVPINSMAYAFVPKDRNNAASALINLSRNIGGSVGIAFVTTFLARRQQYHLHTLISTLTPGSPAYEAFLRNTSSLFTGAAGDVTQHAQSMLYGTVNRQATMQAFIDCYWVLAVMFACMIPTTFFLKRIKPGKASMGH